MRRIQGGRNIYGYDIGVLMLETSFPRTVGDIGNALTWEFPVRYKIVKGQTSYNTVHDLKKENIEPFILAARELEQEGVKAITTSCGFLALFQKELAEAVHVPVFTSALMMVPFLKAMLGDKKVGILTANRKTLTDEHLARVGIEKDTCVIVGLEEQEVFTNYTIHNWSSVDVDACELELRKNAKTLMQKGESIGAIVLECTNMCPYAKAIYEETGVPVYDIVTLTEFMYRAMHHRDYLAEL